MTEIQMAGKQNTELAQKRAEEMNRHVPEVYTISQQIWELHEQHKPLRPLTDMMFRYVTVFHDLYASLTVEMIEGKKNYHTGEDTKILLDQINTEIRWIEMRLGEVSWNK